MFIIKIKIRNLYLFYKWEKIFKEEVGEEIREDLEEEVEEIQKEEGEVEVGVEEEEDSKDKEEEDSEVVKRLWYNLSITSQEFI